jgi:hypothetical protein
MARVVVRSGVLVPVEPLPPDCNEGAEFDAALTPAIDRPKSNGTLATSTDDDGDGISDEDYERLVEALAEADRIEKERMRREMGLS